ncbi:MAG: glutathione S-transferase family protein [Deltaproteobacteria bacterium]|nr:glutathione S-transferase family protein [Deltaproteobacteria bacterium]
MSDAAITLYAHTFRSRAERVIWTLEELQLDYTLIRLDASKGALQAPEFVRLNPAKKIPVLVHGDKVLTESLAIAEYLCALRPDARLLPETPDENYEFRRIVHFTLSEVEAYLWLSDQSSRLRRAYPWPEGTHAQAMKLVKRNIPTLFAQVDEQSFAACGRFTIADIYLWHIFTWASGRGIALPDGVVRYGERLARRSAMPDMLRPT